MLYDLFMKPIMYWSTDRTLTSGYYFYDFNTKLSYWQNEKNVWNIALYAGEDVFTVKTHSIFQNNGDTQQEYKSLYRKKWGNRKAAVHWRHINNEKWETISILSYVDYGFLFKNKTENEKEAFFSETFFSSGIKDLRLNLRTVYFYNEKGHLETGIELSRYKFTPYVVLFQNSGYTSSENKKNYSSSSHLVAFFMEHHLKKNKLYINTGVRLNFVHAPDYLFYFPEPRLHILYQISPSISLTANYSRMSQNLHLLSTNGPGLPVDFWLPATKKAPPETSEQVSSGLRFLFQQHTVDINFYYKNMDQLIIYKPGKTFENFPNSWEELIFTGGTAKSKGLEILFEIKKSNTSTLLGYTLSSSKWKFKEINNGSPFPSPYDIRHKIDLLYNRKINASWDFSLVWQFLSGRPINMAIAKFGIMAPSEQLDEVSQFYSFTEAYLYAPYNSFRTKVYHRLDVGLTYTRLKKRGEERWKINIINVYNRKNVYFYFLQDEQTENGYTTTLKQFTLFPFFPSLGYTRSF